MPGVSWTVVKNLSLFEHVRQKVCIMPASKFSKEFKEQIIAEVLEGSRPIAEVAKSYNLVPQTVGNWVRIWRKQHPDPGMAEASSDQVAEHQTLAG